jgi:hypothetical protein
VTERYKSRVSDTLNISLMSLVSAITNIAFFALGYSRSPHVPGSTKDADFWFLAQASTTQFLGLTAFAFLECKRDKLPKWRWALPTGIAGLCSIMATPFYVVAPTEWSTFLASVASAVQTFMILQHFLTR